MECMDVQDRLAQLLAGTLPPAEEQQVLGHLAVCAECRTDLAFWVRVSGAVVADAPAPAPQTLAQVRDALFGRPEPAADWLTVTRDSLNLVRMVCHTALRLATHPV